MNFKINPRTNLEERWDEFYEIPVVFHKGINQVRLDGQISARHSVPLGKSLTLDFYSNLPKSDELLVALHGANTKDRNFYPRFERVASLRRRGPLLAFADPTLNLDDSRQMLLSWFLGGPGWDPNFSIAKVVNKAKSKTGAKHVAFIGGSGGGFAALRLSAMFPGSMAFVQDPQTDISQYLPLVVQRYFSTVWPGWKFQELVNAFPERFNMAKYYKEFLPKNFVYYVQNKSDTEHVLKHFEPFRKAVGATLENQNRPRNRQMHLYIGEKTGHGKITSSEFDKFYLDAVDCWREYRQRTRTQ